MLFLGQMFSLFYGFRKLLETIVFLKLLLLLLPLLLSRESFYLSSLSSIEARRERRVRNEYVTVLLWWQRSSDVHEQRT